MLYANRHEIKYQISFLDQMAIVNKLDPFLERDSSCKEGEYTVSSLYYDDPYNSALTQKINGDSVRHKYRIRYYNNDSSKMKLERKSKVHRMTQKTSAFISGEECKALMNKEYSFLLDKEEALYHDFYKGLTLNHLTPKVIVRYKRLSFVHPIGNLRITFDSEISTSVNQLDFPSTDTSFIPLMENNEVIMEIKFNGMLPDFIRDLIQSGHVMAGSYSKYVYSRKYNYEL